MLRRRLLGLAGLLGIVAFVLVTLGIYQKTFTSSVRVTVMADRAGLLLDEGADVRLFGIPVGRVESVRTVDDRVAIAVDLEPDEARKVPLGTTSTIQASTVFGSKYVALELPEQRVGTRPLGAGDVIEASATTVEVNDVFETALGLVESVDPVALNTTLTSMATALEGRGDDLGEIFERSDRYLTTFNEHLPALEDGLERAGGVLDLYADVTPELIDTASQAGTTSATLADKQAALRTTLRDVTTSSRRIEQFVRSVEDPLDGALSALRPVTDLLERFAPAVTCSITYLDATQASLTQVAAKDKPGIQMFTGFLPAQDAYKPGKNLPKFISGVGPVCQPLPTLESPRPPHVNFRDGTEGTYDNDPGLEVRTPIEIYEEGFSQFFGESGLALLLEDLAKGSVTP